MPDSSKSSTWFLCGSTVVFGAWVALIVATVTNGPSQRAPAATVTAQLATVQPGAGLAGPLADRLPHNSQTAPTFTHLRLSQTTRRGLFAGQAEPHAHIVLLRAGKALADTRANAGGGWQIATVIAEIGGDHEFAVEQRAASGAFVSGDEIRLHVPAGFGPTINVTRAGPTAGFQLVAVRAEGEDLGPAASRKFDSFFEKRPGAEGTARRGREVAQLGDEILEPAWSWLRDASRSYHDEVVPRIKRGGGYDLDDGVVRERARTERKVVQPQRRTAQRRVSDERSVRSPAWGDGDGSWMPPGIGDWLSAAQRGYTTEIVPRLSGEVPATIIARRPDVDDRDDIDDARRRRERERTATDRAEQERLDAARRRREAERRRQEAEEEARRIAAERRQSELEEARKIAAERKRVLARRAEQQRQAAAEAEAERRRRQEREAELARQQDEAEKAALERQRQADREADDAERERKRLAELNLRRREREREAEAERQRIEQERRDRLIEEAAAIKRRQAEARLRDRAERQRRFDEQRAAAERQRAEARRRAREEAERERRARQRQLAQQRAEQAERDRAEAVARAAARQRALAAERRRRERQATRETRRPALPAQRPQVIAQRRDDANRFNRRETEIVFSVDGRRSAADESVREASPRSRTKARFKRRVAAYRKRARKTRRREVRSYRRRARLRKSSLRCGRKAGRRIKPPGTYVVKPGDSLWRIAKRHYRLGRYFKIIRRANARKIRRARMIYPCQRLHLPRKRRA